MWAELPGIQNNSSLFSFEAEGVTEPEPEPRSYTAKLSVLSTISVLTLVGNLTILLLLLTRQGKVS